jgi:hypothetical protein
MVCLRLIVPLTLIAVSVGGCMESKSDVFAACYDEHVGYFLKPRPQGRPPDDYLLRSLTACMYFKGFRAVTKAEAECSSPRTVSAGCFQSTWWSIVWPF